MENDLDGNFTINTENTTILETDSILTKEKLKTSKFINNIIDEDEFKYVELFETHSKLIKNYEYSKLYAKLKKIYFFPKPIVCVGKPECFSVRYSKCDTLIAGGYSTGHIVVYDVSTGDYIKYMSLSDYPISSIRFKQSGSKPILNACHSDGKVSQWFPTGGKILYQYEEKDNFIMCMDFNHYGNLFATGGSDNTVRIYDDDTKTMIYTMNSNFDNNSHSSRIFSICFGKSSINENLLVSGGWDNTLKFYDVKQKKIVNSINGPHIIGDSIDMKGFHIITGSSDLKDQVKIWDIRNFKCIETIKFDPTHKNKDFFVTSINCAQFSKASDSLLEGKRHHFNSFAVGGQKRGHVTLFSDEPNIVNPDIFVEKYKGLYCIEDDEDKHDHYIHEKESKRDNTSKLSSKLLHKLSSTSILPEIVKPKREPVNRKVPIIKVDNLNENIYSLDYMNNCDILSYTSGLGCIYTIDIHKTKEEE